jgi:hypothetical protein
MNNQPELKLEEVKIETPEQRNERMLAKLETIINLIKEKKKIKI